MAQAKTFEVWIGFLEVLPASKGIDLNGELPYLLWKET
jgi:hypothetical protein